MSLKPSRNLSQEQHDAIANPETVTHRVIVEVVAPLLRGYTEEYVRRLIDETLRLHRPNFIRNYRVVGYSKVQAGETRRIKNALRKAGAEETEAATVKQRGRKK